MIRPLIAAVLLVAASPVLADCPSTGLARAPATFVTAKGKFRYTLEIAASGEEQECGLMHRKTMHRRAGMIFPFVQPRLASFWMENTPLPLDLIFVDADNRVINFKPGKPFSRDLINSAGITAAVIELNAGEAQRIGLQPGDLVLK
ncbi:MAG: DUF192 domain-containing protein [Polymorphobacter sp.]